MSAFWRLRGWARRRACTGSGGRGRVSGPKGTEPSALRMHEGLPPQRAGLGTTKQAGRQQRGMFSSAGSTTKKVLLT